MGGEKFNPLFIFKGKNSIFIYYFCTQNSKKEGILLLFIIITFYFIFTV